MLELTLVSLVQQFVLSAYILHILAHAEKIVIHPHVYNMTCDAQDYNNIRNELFLTVVLTYHLTLLGFESSTKRSGSATRRRKEDEANGS